jgi:hypothetical protein
MISGFLLCRKPLPSFQVHNVLIAAELENVFILAPFKVEKNPTQIRINCIFPLLF